MTLCGHLTKRGQPCKRPQLAAWQGFWERALVFHAPACYAHASPEDKAEYERICAEIKADNERVIIETQQSLPVECWNWPVTDDHRRQAREARACTDPAESRRIAWKLLAGWQRHRCAICGDRSEHLDHDHKTGLVRGWLCRCCNIGEGCSPIFIPGGQFERYREKNPASILGIEIRYYSPFTGWAEPAPDPLPLEQHAAFVLAERFGSRRDA